MLRAVRLSHRPRDSNLFYRNRQGGVMRSFVAACSRAAERRSRLKRANARAGLRARHQCCACARFRGMRGYGNAVGGEAEGSIVEQEECRQQAGKGMEGR